MVITSAATIYIVKKKKQSPKISPIQTEKPIRKNVVQIITASGNLKAKEQISVGSLVAGKVVEIRVDDNDAVKKDQILAVLDDGVGDSDVKKLKAVLVEAKANAEYMTKYFNRQKELYKSGQISQNNFDKLTQDYKVALAKVDQTKADLEKAEKVDGNLLIKSPADGIVIAKRVDLGQMVTAQLQATVLFEIAKDLHEMEAYLDVDEADVGMVKEGQEAIFTVDSFPKKHFEAKVKRIQYQAKIVDNVVTYATVLDVKNPKSETIFPSINSIILFDFAAMDGSCVTMINVTLLFSFKSLNACKIFSPVARSRFPVGSSAMIIAGLFIKDLAIATLCCCPPESWYG